MEEHQHHQLRRRRSNRRGRIVAASQFDASVGRDVPAFEYTPRSITRLHALATASKANTHAASIIASDLCLKASDYRSQDHCLVSLVDGLLTSTTSSQPQVPTQTPQAAVINHKWGFLTPTLPQSSFHWSHAFLVAGLLAASGAGTAVLFKKAVVPRLKSWIRKVVLEKDDYEKTDNPKPTMVEEAAAAVAAADVARASQKLLNSKSEDDATPNTVKWITVHYLKTFTMVSN